MNSEKDYYFLADFSRMEFQIFKFVAKGYSSKEIAKILSLKDGTVRNYISSLMHKMGLKSRTQVILYALQNGLEIERVRVHS